MQTCSFFFSALLIILPISGCSGGSSPSTTSTTTTPPPPTNTTPPPTTTTTPTPDVVGSASWTATALSSTGQLSTIIVQFAGQTTLTGQLQVLGDPAFDSTSFPVTGSIDSSGKITFSGTQGQETLSVSATASTDGSSLPLLI